MSLMPGPGGNGGGAIFFTALRATLGANAVTVGGETCVSASSGSFDYGCGGGAGGALYVRIQTLTATGVVGTARRGRHPPSPPGASHGPAATAAAGASRVDVRTINTLMGGTTDATTAVNAAFNPTRASSPSRPDRATPPARRRGCTLALMERLTHPLVRGDNGALRAATWDERSTAPPPGSSPRRPPTAHLRRVFCLLLEGDQRVNYLAQKGPARGGGNNNIDSCNRT